MTTDLTLHDATAATADLRALQAELAANPLTAVFASGELESVLVEYEKEFRDESADTLLLEFELDYLKGNVRAGLSAAGKPDEERCDIAASLAAGWAVDRCNVFTRPQVSERLVRDALVYALLDQPMGKQRAAEVERLMPAALAAVKVIEAEWEKDRAELAHVEAIRHAKAMAPIDRETLGIDPVVELTHELIEQAKATAEAAAGMAKNGKPFKRFANAAARLITSIEWELVERGGSDD